VKYLLLTLAALLLAGICYLSKRLESNRKPVNDALRLAIIVKDQELWVEGFLRKLFRLARGISGLEIVVIDDDSKDRTLNIVERLQRSYSFDLSFARGPGDIAEKRVPAGSRLFDARGLTGRDLLNAPVFAQLRAFGAGKSSGLSK